MKNFIKKSNNTDTNLVTEDCYREISHASKEIKLKLFLSFKKNQFINYIVIMERLNASNISQSQKIPA